MKSQNADFSVLLTLKKPTRGMIVEAAKEGRFKQRIPKIQLLTVEDLFKKPRPVILPPEIIPPHKKTSPVKKITFAGRDLFNGTDS